MPVLGMGFVRRLVPFLNSPSQLRRTEGSTPMKLHQAGVSLTWRELREAVLVNALLLALRQLR